MKNLAGKRHYIYPRNGPLYMNNSNKVGENGVGKGAQGTSINCIRPRVSLMQTTVAKQIQAKMAKSSYKA